MAQFKKIVGSNGNVRYHNGKAFVSPADVSKVVAAALDELPAGTLVDELGDAINPATDTDEGTEDEVLPTVPPKIEDATTTEDENEDETPAPTKPVAAPRPRNTTKPAEVEMGGMGFPAKGGKTLSVFSDVPHETVKNVGGILVPMTLVELQGDKAKNIEPKTDTEIINRLKELGKI